MEDVKKKEIAVLDPKKKYIMTMGLSSNLHPDKKLEIINKTALKFKLMGIKNIEVLPHTMQVFEVK